MSSLDTTCLCVEPHHFRIISISNWTNLLIRLGMPLSSCSQTWWHNVKPADADKGRVKWPMAEPDVTWLNSEAQLISLQFCYHGNVHEWMAFALFTNSTFKCRRQILKSIYMQAVGEFDLVGREWRAYARELSEGSWQAYQCKLLDGLC